MLICRIADIANLNTYALIRMSLTVVKMPVRLSVCGEGRTERRLGAPDGPMILQHR
jgi:hypothetical protein